MHAPVTADDLQRVLLARFPDLEREYEELLAWRPDPGNHLVFTNVFLPYLFRLLETTGSDAATAAAFTFIEELAQNSSPGVQEVVALAVLERFTDEPRLLKAAWPFMGDATRRFVVAIAKASS